MQENDPKLRELTQSAIDQLLNLRLTHDLVKYRIDESIGNWRNLQEQLHAEQYPIKAAGVIATPKNIGSVEVDAWEGGFLHRKEDIAPEDIVSNLSSYPLAAASSAYAFSVMEMYGNDVAILALPDQKTN